jgi:hypothetical protein
MKRLETYISPLFAFNLFLSFNHGTLSKRPKRWFLKVRGKQTQRPLEICLLGVTSDSGHDRQMIDWLS